MLNYKIIITEEQALLLKKENRISFLFALEKKAVSNESYLLALKKFNPLLAELKELVLQEKNKGLSLVENLLAATDHILDRYIIDDTKPETLLTEYLAKYPNILDCDSLAFVLLALCDELGWPAEIKSIHRHVWLVCESTNIDQGNIFTTKYYSEQLKIPEGKTLDLLEPLDNKKLQALFLGNIANYHFRQGALQQASGKYKASLALNKKDTDAWHNYGLLLETLERPDEAYAAYMQAVNTFPNNIFALNNLGQLLTEYQQPEKAIPFLTHANTLTGGQDLETLLNFGAALYANKNNHAAQKVFLKATGLAPANFEAQDNLANTFVVQGELARAISILQQLLAGELSAEQRSFLQQKLAFLKTQR
jgi:tetratricopeptide (TPR) repeat protein